MLNASLLLQRSTEAVFTQLCFYTKTERFVYVLPICLHEHDENAPENKDLSGDFENEAGRTHKNTHVNSKNEYLVNTEVIDS